MEWLHYTRKILSRQMCDSALCFFLSSNIGLYKTSSPRETKLFSCSASCHFGTKKCVSIGEEKIVLRWSIIFTSAPTVHKLKMKLLHQRRRSCQLPIRRRGSSTYVPEAQKFSLSASVVVTLARLHLRLGRFWLCVFEFGFFFRIEKILALQLFAAHFFFGFHHFAHHT